MLSQESDAHLDLISLPVTVLRGSDNGEELAVKPGREMKTQSAEMRRRLFTDAAG